MIKGFDISVIQHNTNFVAMYNAGYRFCMLRCGVGNDGIDTDYTANVKNATAAGLMVGAYNFVYPLPSLPNKPATRDPKLQAQMHAHAIGDVKVVAVDVEWPAPQDFAKWQVSAQSITQWLETYLEEFQSITGILPIIYIYPFYAQTLNLPASFAKYPLWIASYETKPTIPAPWNDFVLWQNYGGTEKMPDGRPVDTDLAKDLSLWGAGTDQTTANVAVEQPAQSPIDAVVPAVENTPPVAPEATQEALSQVQAPSVPIVSQNASTVNLMSKLVQALNIFMSKVFYKK